MNKDELNRIIEKGESLTVEFKSWINTPKKERVKKAATELVSFANSKGGTVYFGIEDNGTVTGCNNYDAQSILDGIYDATSPHLFVECEELKYDDFVILAFKVENDGIKYSTSDGVSYRRLGKNNRPIYLNDALDRTKNDSIDYSAKILDESTMDDIDLLEVYKLKDKLRIRDSKSTLVEMDDIPFLKDLELIKEDKDEIRLTIAGLLFVGKKESISRLLPQAEVTYLRYEKGNPTEYSFREDMKMPIISTLDRLTDQINLGNRITNIQIGLFRMEIKDYPEAVFQEAVLNAMTHRDYENGASIYIKHYEDKIVVESPGGFVGGITEDNIITHPSVPRNKRIAETLQRLKYVQRSGQGVDIIYRDMISFGKPFPDYHVYDDFIVLTLQSTMENPSFVRFIVNEQERRQVVFSVSELIVLKYLTDNKAIQISKVQKITQSSMETSRKTCNSLVDFGLIEVNGKSYMLTAKAYQNLKSNVEYARDKTIQYIKAKEMILEYLKNNKSITNNMIQELCGFTKQQARRTIDKMIKENLIKKIGASKNTAYIKEN